MHYPNMVSCDFDTYHNSKLSQDVFRVLPPKAMKGVGNITVYEYIQGEMGPPGTTLVIKPKYDLVGLEAEKSAFENVLNDLTNREVGF